MRTLNEIGFFALMAIAGIVFPIARLVIEISKDFRKFLSDSWQFAEKFTAGGKMGW